jgi:hypothetical protein
VRAIAFGLAVALSSATACAGPKTPEPANDNPDYVVADAGPAPDSYVYVAKRPLAIVGLAEARGMDDVQAKATVDKIADILDACATEQARAGQLADGAARVVAIVGPGGTVEGTNVSLAPGGAVAANALLCLDSPVKLLTFPPSKVERRGFAIEAVWGQKLVRPR